MTIDLKEDKSQLVMNINDNGCGMTLAQMHKPQSYGIQGMNERARNFGGQVTFISTPGKGTTMKLFMPLHASKSGNHHD